MNKDQLWRRIREAMNGILFGILSFVQKKERHLLCFIMLCRYVIIMLPLIWLDNIYNILQFRLYLYTYYNACINTIAWITYSWICIILANNNTFIMHIYFIYVNLFLLYIYYEYSTLYANELHNELHIYQALGVFPAGLFPFKSFPHKVFSTPINLT